MLRNKLHIKLHLKLKWISCESNNDPTKHNWQDGKGTITQIWSGVPVDENTGRYFIISDGLRIYYRQILILIYV